MKKLLEKVNKKVLIGLIVVVVGVGGFFAVKEIVTCKHEELGWKVAQVATCTSEGIKNEECLKCGKIMQSESLPRLEHDWVFKPYVGPTCAEYGWEEGMACSLCDTRQDQSKRIEKLPHTIVEDAFVEATCLEDGLTAGTHCTVCNEAIVPQEKIPAKGHNFVMTTNQCSECSVKEYDKEIKSVNEFSEGIKSDECVVFLDYAVPSNQSSNIVQSIPSDCKYVRLIGTVGKTYPIIFQIQERAEAFTLDLVNTQLITIGAKSVIVSQSSAQIVIGCYGENVAIKAGKASNGSNGSIGLDGGNGANGATTLSINGNVVINVRATKCEIIGGAGGNGGKGSDGSVGNNGMGRGGNGGNGGIAISSTSIIVNLFEGYTKENITIAGGSGGNAGAGGSPGLFGNQYGASGNAGNQAIASNIEIVYQNKN